MSLGKDSGVPGSSAPVHKAHELVRSFLQTFVVMAVADSSQVERQVRDWSD